MPTTSDTDHVAHASVTISASPERVWEALTDPNMIKQYMFGSTVTSSWKVGAPITWKGEMNGKAYEDKGSIQRFDPPRLIEYTHFSPLSGQPDVPENYHLVRVKLSPADGATRVDLEQTGNPTEESRKHSENNWTQMLNGMKKVVETPDVQSQV